MTGVPQVIQLLVAPVVMISAAGLICLALYNRLAAIVSRARIFHRERFEALAHLAALPAAEQGEAPAQQLRSRAAALEDQCTRILRRARLVRNALACILVEVLCMLGASLALGLSLLAEVMAQVALGLFIAGVLVMMLGMVLALVELAGSLEPVTAEGFALETRGE